MKIKYPGEFKILWYSSLSRKIKTSVKVQSTDLIVTLLCTIQYTENLKQRSTNSSLDGEK